MRAWSSEGNRHHASASGLHSAEVRRYPSPRSARASIVPSGTQEDFVRDHRTLIAFELADQLALIVYRESRHFPREEMFNLTSQMRKAAVSVPSNIVEGCARHTELGYLRFLDTAYGSTRELEYQISLAIRLGYLPESNESMPTCEETGRVIHGLIESMRPSPKGKTRPRSRPQSSAYERRAPGGGSRPREP